MKNKEELSVSGFRFETEEAAEKAKEELQGIEVVRNKTNMRSPETVLEVYNKLIDKRLCKQRWVTVIFTICKNISKIPM